MKARRLVVLALALVTVVTMGIGYAALNDALFVKGICGGRSCHGSRHGRNDRGRAYGSPRRGDSCGRSSRRGDARGRSSCRGDSRSIKFK